MAEFIGRLHAVGRVAILVSRYNELVTTKLLEGARACCRDAGLDESQVDVVWTPGAFELPTAAAAAAGCDPFVDAAYRRELVAVLVRDALVRVRAELVA